MFYLKQSTILEVVLDNDISDCIKHKLDVVGVGSASKMSVHFFRILALVQVLELILYVG